MTLLVSEITLKNVRCYKNVTINLAGDDGPHSLLIAGNNGSGKSALLRSIAMGLCDQASAGSLLRELLGDFIRKQNDSVEDERNASISIKLVDVDLKEKYEICTILTTYSQLGFEVVEQKLTGPDGDTVDQIKFPWDRIFISAYGAGLRTEGTEDYAQYFAGDAVYTLFKYAHTLQNPELVWRRLRVASKKKNDKKVVDREVESKLLSILNLNDNTPPASSKNSVMLQVNGIHVTSEWGKQELDALGDGYRALITMTMDIIGWQLLRQNNATILEEIDTGKSGIWQPLEWNKIDGIVIIDEIEKHLHPKLQRTVIDRLVTVFPKIQFLISTHSPLCISGAADVSETTFRVLAAHRNEDGGRGISEKPIPVGFRADQVLVDYFGLSTTVSPVWEKKVNELRELILLKAKHKLILKQQERLEDLRAELGRHAPLLYEREEDREIMSGNQERYEKMLRALEDVKNTDD
ncbi:MAG: AAA family ATPase [Alphaproteobacteria bacterium]|nr:AAA family ATPase [Alphaproteobacteria bacterium]